MALQEELQNVHELSVTQISYILTFNGSGMLVLP